MTQEQDRELERYLEGDSGLSEAYARLPEAGPPAHLDHAILAEAHRAVRAQPGRPAWRRWTLPLSVAATLVVAVLVGLEQSYLPREVGHAVSPPSGAAGDVAQDKLAAPAAAPPQTEGKARGAAPAATASVAKKEAGPAPTRLKEAQPAAPVADEAPPAVTGTPAGQGTPETRRAERVAPAAPAPSGGKLQAPATPGPAEAAPAAQQMLRMNAAPAAPAPQAEPAMERAPAAAAPAPTMEMAPAAPAAAMLGDTSASSMVDGASAPLAPGPWLARIEKLKREGKREAAQKDLAAFIKRYPAYPVPKDLQDLRGQ